MFNITDNNKKYQCPSEFGLYKCDETNDCYSVRKKSRFGFGYLVILLTSVIVLSSVCVVVYNVISRSNTTLKPRLIKNETEPSTDSYINISFVHEISNETIKNQSESGPAEPQALEYASRNIRYHPESNIPRPFIYEIRDPKPTGFHVDPANKPKIYEDNEAAENSVKPIRTRVRNIQDIIKLLTNSEDQDTNSKRTPKKSKRKNSQPFIASDPFFPYKPQNPSDINLLATNGLRFAPTIQLDSNKKKHQFVEQQYPNYERPIDSKYSNEQPISVTLDLSQNQRIKKRKPLNYPVGFNNLYNHNQYFHPGSRFQTPQQQHNKPYFRPWNNWNLTPNVNKQKQKKAKNPTIVHLNLYPKKRKPLGDTETEESRLHHNCSDYYNHFAQIKNASEFNHLMENSRHHQTLDPIYNGKVTTTDNDLYSVKDEPYQFIKNRPPSVEIQKSIGFTIMNPNFSLPQLTEEDYYSSNGESESQWHPIAIADDENMSNSRDDHVEDSDKDDNYGLEVGEVNESSDETATLPLPQDLFEKYFNTKPVLNKFNEDWDPNVIKENPNLINHRASFYDRKDNV